MAMQSPVILQPLAPTVPSCGSPVEKSPVVVELVPVAAAVAASRALKSFFRLWPASFFVTLAEAVADLEVCRRAGEAGPRRRPL